MNRTVCHIIVRESLTGLADGSVFPLFTNILAFHVLIAILKNAHEGTGIRL